MLLLNKEEFSKLSSELKAIKAYPKKKKMLTLQLNKLEKEESNLWDSVPKELDSLVFRLFLLESWKYEVRNEIQEDNRLSYSSLQIEEAQDIVYLLTDIKSRIWKLSLQIRLLDESYEALTNKSNKNNKSHVDF